MHSTPQRYEVEWEDKEGYINTLVVYARVARLAEEKALKKLSKRSDFKELIHVELYP